MPQDLINNAIKELEQALTNHQKWSETMVFGVLSDELPEATNLAPGAHTLCKFGMWYYGQDHSTILTQHPAFNELEFKHRNMHDTARAFLQAPKGPPKALAYLEFSRASQALTQFIFDLIEILLTVDLSTDALTGLPNRSRMEVQLKSAIKDLARSKENTACLAMMDLDFFKHINDAYGHVVGDAVLKSVGQQLLNNMRDNDLVYRYGGEEFLIFMKYVDLETAKSALDRLREKISAFELSVIGQDAPLHITASFGIAQLAENEPLKDLINRADNALYIAKRAGRNCVKTADTPPESP